MRILEHRREQDKHLQRKNKYSLSKSPHVLTVLLLAHRRHYHHSVTPHTHPQIRRDRERLQNERVTPTPPPHPLPRRGLSRVSEVQNAAPPVDLERNRIEAAGQARGGEHKRSFTSQGARCIRSAPAATEPRRHPDPAAAAVLRNLESRRPKETAFSTEIFINNREEKVYWLLWGLCLGGFKFRSAGQRTGIG